MITRLQLGTSRLENLQPEVLQKFLDKSWMHLGDPEPISKRYTIPYLFEIYKKHGTYYICARVFQKLLSNKSKAANVGLNINDIYNSTNFREFYYHKGDKLPFDDNSINFIYSEHFFEHLFIDEAFSLLEECFRILKPFGVIRTCVTDADLRTYEPPEPIGFPHIKVPYTDPSKHKTRWSIYSLEQIIKLAGFDSVPLRYCNKSGQYIKRDLSYAAKIYEKCDEQELIYDVSYISRIDSLIVDGIKKASK